MTNEGKEKPNAEKQETSLQHQPSTNQPVASQEETVTTADTTHPQGRIAGGTFLKNLSHSENAETEGPLKEVDIDLPLTLTQVIQKDGQEYILLNFVQRDKENPFNWSRARKGAITVLLCMMTLFIGLATTAYSSGIDSMVKELDTSTEMGELGLFCFNIACG